MDGPFSDESLGRTRPDADISVLEKVVTVLGIATKEEECTRAQADDKDTNISRLSKGQSRPALAHFGWPSRAGPATPSPGPHI